MANPIGNDQAAYASVLGHVVRRVAAAPAETRPFGHAYFEDLFPQDVYARLLAGLPEPDLYDRAAERHHRGEVGGYTRAMFPLSLGGLEKLPPATRAVWRLVAAVLTAPELRQAVYAKLAPDLAYRYGIDEARIPDLAGHSRPTLYRETEGFEIPPHPDTRRKVVTMHLYLPADATQVGLGTALYKRHPLALPLGGWRNRFSKVKQFAFLPNSGYAFVVNNSLGKRSWHGRERLPDGAGVRNTLLNTYYETFRDGFGGYYPTPAATQPEPQRRAA